MRACKLIFSCLLTLFLGVLSVDAANLSNNQYRAISLKVLQQQLRGVQGKSNSSSDISHLCGITTLLGYITDEVHSDIVLIGKVEKGKPPLYLDDFVIALRNAWMKYTELIGNTNYYSDPGCSIDPDPVVVSKLDKIGSKLTAAESLSEKETVLNEWEKTCSSPQKVRVIGVPFNSHFASVMVKADYDMKRIADGSDELNLLWFSTLAELQMDDAKGRYIHNHSSSGPNQGLNRFWFCPGEYRFIEDDGAVMIETLRLKLQTEAEHLSETGDIIGTGCTDSAAEKFAADFSSFYEEVAAQRPIYQELENLFRFVAVAKAIKMKTPDVSVGLSLDYLLDKYPVANQKVEPFLPGRSNINRYKQIKPAEGGSMVSQLLLPSCGGVTMEIDMKPEHFIKKLDPVIKELKEAVVLLNASPNLFSDISSNDYYAVVFLNTEGALSNGHVAIALGNSKNGYYYFSKNGSTAPNAAGERYKEITKYYFPQYDRAFQIKISEAQFDAMLMEANNDINTPYHLNTNNCADFVHNVLESAGGDINPGRTQTLKPNNYFTYVESKNNTTKLW